MVKKILVLVRYLIVGQIQVYLKLSNLLASCTEFHNTVDPITENENFFQLDGSLPANPVNDRRIANAVTLKSTFCLL